jgi:hypothetical protein
VRETTEIQYFQEFQGFALLDVGWRSLGQICYKTQWVANPANIKSGHL